MVQVTLSGPALDGPPGRRSRDATPSKAVALLKSGIGADTVAAALPAIKTAATDPSAFLDLSTGFYSVTEVVHQVSRLGWLEAPSGM